MKTALIVVLALIAARVFLGFTFDVHQTNPLIRVSVEPGWERPAPFQPGPPQGFAPSGYRYTYR